jgi:hypothetical protein
MSTFDKSAGASHQAGMLALLPPLVSARVAVKICPSFLCLQVVLEWPHLTFQPWDQQYLFGSHSGLTGNQCASRGQLSELVDVKGVAAGAGRRRHAVAALASARAFASFSLAARSLSTVSFFCIVALARLLREVAIWAACSASEAVWLEKALSPAVMRLMLHASVKAVVQWSSNCSKCVQLWGIVSTRAM